jgi:transposase-like protein
VSHRTCEVESSASNVVGAATSDHVARPGNGKIELKAEFVRLRATGLSYARIADQLGVGKSTLSNWNAELEGEIASARALELEALQEQYSLLREGRIRLLGEQLQRIRNELGSRDLTSIPTDKLLDLQLKVFAALKEEFVETRTLSESEQQRLRTGS